MKYLVKSIYSMDGHSDVEVLDLGNGTEIALSGWNGQYYTDCWYIGETEKFEMHPIYKEVDEDEYGIFGYVSDSYDEYWFHDRYGYHQSENGAYYVD